MFHDSHENCALRGNERSHFLQRAVIDVSRPLMLILVSHVSEYSIECIPHFGQTGVLEFMESASDVAVVCPAGGFLGQLLYFKVFGVAGVA